MKITFLGAAGEVTGSQHLVETEHRRILLDCGLFQGRREESRRKNETFHCQPAKLDALILSHAHIDHCGNVPGLYKAGFRGPIFCTPATAEIATTMLLDSVRIQAEDARYLSRHLQAGHPRLEPLYEEEHVRAISKLMESLAYHQWHDVGKDVRIRFSDSGHILGSAIVELEVKERGGWKRLIFSGDLGRRHTPLLRDPDTVDGGDVLITESTYGSRLHPPAEDLKEELARLITKTAGRGGRVIIPAFSLGRTQTVLYFLNELSNAGRLPSIPVYVDSPLSRELTQTYRRHLDDLDIETQRSRQIDKDPFSFPGMSFVSSPQESMELNRRRDPMVVIAASGMCESGRVVHHLKHGLANERNTIALIGFQAEHTLGRRIQERRPTVRIFDRVVPVAAEVESLSGLSAHADQEEFRWWFERLESSGGVGQAFIVHGEREGAQGVAHLLDRVSHEPPVIPQFGQSFEV